MLAHGWFAAWNHPAPRPKIDIDVISAGRGGLCLAATPRGPLNVGRTTFEHGLSAGDVHELVLRFPSPASRLTASVGIDRNRFSLPHPDRPTTVVLKFTVETPDGQRLDSPPRSVMDEAHAFDINLDGATTVKLLCRPVSGSIRFPYAVWGDLTVTLADGQVVQVSPSATARAIPTEAPFSFKYGGNRVNLNNWPLTVQDSTSADGLAQRKLIWRHPATGLVVTAIVTLYSEALEWVLWFKNEGSLDTPLIEDILPLDGSYGAIGDIQLRRTTGERIRGFVDGRSDSRGDFETQDDSVGAFAPVCMDSGEGRSSCEWLPFFNLHTATQGVNIAIGWSGRWKFEADRDSPTTVQLRSGLYKTRFYLKPGEHIRTPRILLQFWDGDITDGQNKFRHLMLEHYSPRNADGSLQRSPICNITWGGMNTADHLVRIERMAQADIARDHDYYWIDAGWYGADGDAECVDVFAGDWNRQTGDWSPNRKLHPDGLLPISRAVQAAGMKLMLWVEPERAAVGTPIVKQRPDWFLAVPEHLASRLLDLSREDVLAYTIDTIDTLIRDYELGGYRQDFNVDPYPFWRSADGTDRIGFTESKHIEHLYAFWDEIRARHPELVIDNCASGGRRLDIETAARSIPLWRSDHQCWPEYDTSVSQAQWFGLSPWVPLHGTGTAPCTNDTYRVRSAYGSGLVMEWSMYEYSTTGQDYPFGWHKEMLQEFQRLRPLILGDYYPLTPGGADPTAWVAHSFLVPEKQEGFAVVFCREQCPFLSGQLRLKGLDPEQIYVLTLAHSPIPGNAWEASGRELMEKGLRITFQQPRSSVVVHFQAKNRPQN